MFWEILGVYINSFKKVDLYQRRRIQRHKYMKVLPGTGRKAGLVRVVCGG